MIRTADQKDSEQLEELLIGLHRFHVEGMPETFRMPGREWFSRRVREILDHTVFVCEDDGELNGFAAVKITDVNLEEKLPRRVCYIDCLAVAEGSRRKGIGAALFEAVKAYGKEQGCTSVQLGFSAWNRQAALFYQKMGLVPRTIIMEMGL